MKKGPKMKGMKRRGVRKAVALGTAAVIAANINLSAISNVLKNKAERIFSALSGRRIEWVQKGRLGEEEPGIRDIFGPSSAWAEITPEMVRGWFENVPKDARPMLWTGASGHIYPWAHFIDGTKKYGNTIATLRPRKSNLYFTGERNELFRRIRLSNELGSLGIKEFSKNARMVGAGTRRSIDPEDGKEKGYHVYYIVDVDMRGVLAVEATQYYEPREGGPPEFRVGAIIHTLSKHTPITEGFDMVALPNNGCAVATQNDVLALEFNQETGEIKMSSWGLNEATKNEGERPMNPQLAYYSVGNKVLVALRADNWRHTYLFDLTSGRSGSVLASK